MNREVSSPNLATVVCSCVTLHIADLWQYYIYCIRMGWNQMHPHHGALPGSYVTVRVTNRSLVVHHYNCTPPPRCRTSQYRKTFNPLSVSMWRAWWPCIRWSGTTRRGLKEQGACFFFYCLGCCSLSLLLSMHELVFWYSMHYGISNDW